VTLLRRATRAVAALALTGAATIGAANLPAEATTTPTHVAIVVDGVGTACVPWHSGMTGTNVLDQQAGGAFQVVYGRTGLIDRINGSGSDNPISIYWSYWRSAGSTWSYSGSGPMGTHPAAGSVEGWVFNDGSVPPAEGVQNLYQSICTGQDPTPAPTNPPSTHHTTPAPSVAPSQPAQPTTPAPQRTRNGRGTSASSGPGATSSSAKQHGPAKVSPSSARATVGNTTAPNSSQPAVQLVGAAPRAKHTSAAPALGTGLALVAALSIGGAAYWRLRAQRQN
jgi:hypothetical protein